jgi:hydroxypyruvate reductase
VRTVLADIFRAGVAAAHGGRLLAAHSRFDGRAWSYRRGGVHARLDLPGAGRVLVVGAGKAAAALGEGLEAVLGERIDAGRLVVKYGHGAPLRRIEALEAGHPTPDAAGQAATRKVLECVAGLTADDRVFVLLTGGASALLTAPAPGLTLEDKQAVTGLLLRSGADIREINTVRRRLSSVKGGGLARAIGPAPSLTLMISDIPDGDLALIGSGPTWPDPPRPAKPWRSSGATASSVKPRPPCCAVWPRRRSPRRFPQPSAAPTTSCWPTAPRPWPPRPNGPPPSATPSRSSIPA